MDARTLIIMTACLGTGLAGCATSLPIDTAAASPADLVVEVVTRRAPELAPAETPALAAGRYLVTPDGAVWHASEPDGEPSRVRGLSRDGLAAFWSDVVALGFDPATGGTPPDGATPTPPAEGVACDIAVTANGRRRVFTRLGPEDSFDRSTTALCRRLAALAWVTDPAPATIIAPRRYDLGPDPYARYRTP